MNKRGKRRDRHNERRKRVRFAELSFAMGYLFKKVYGSIVSDMMPDKSIFK
jgi:hypothetical protein